MILRLATCLSLDGLHALGARRAPRIIVITITSVCVYAYIYIYIYTYIMY